MARKSKKRRTPQTPPASAPVEDAPKRRSLKVLGAWGLGAAVVAGGGGALARDFQRKLAEHDLTQIGQGTPTVVQIHDPNCGLCRALQREARIALKEFDANDVTYLVANIRSTEGAAFAAQMGLGHVTLVLLDGAGQRRGIVEGVTPANQISRQLTRDLAVRPTS